MKTRTNYLDDYAARRLRINRLVTEVADRGDFNAIRVLNRLLDDWISAVEQGKPMPVSRPLDPEPEAKPTTTIADVTREMRITSQLAAARTQYPNRGVRKLPGNRARPWQATITCDSRPHSLGYFATREEAREAYLAAYEHKLRHGKLP